MLLQYIDIYKDCFWSFLLPPRFCITTSPVCVVGVSVQNIRQKIKKAQRRGEVKGKEGKKLICFCVFFTKDLFLIVEKEGGLVSGGVLQPVKMSYNSPTVGSGSGSAGRGFEFGRTHVVRPKGKHQATIVWLHGLGDNGSSCSQLLESLHLPNIKWICPTAPTRPVAAFGGFPCTAWFDVGELSADGPDDVVGLDAAAAHVENLLSTEPSDIKLGVAGFSMGAATALYSATCCAQGKYGNGNQYRVNLSVVVGLSGWLPCSRTLRSKIEGSHEIVRRAASLPILLCHGRGDDVVQYNHGEKSAQLLSATGFRSLTFRTYNGLGHHTVPQEMDDVCNWLNSRLGLDGSRS